MTRTTLLNRTEEEVLAIKELLSDEEFALLLNYALEGTGYKTVKETPANQRAQ